MRKLLYILIAALTFSACGAAVRNRLDCHSTMALLPNYTKNGCRHSVVKSIGDTDCCCNCVHRHVLMVGGMPMKYYCVVKTPDSDKPLMTEISYTGHAMCELLRELPRTNSEVLRFFNGNSLVVTMKYATFAAD